MSETEQLLRQSVRWSEPYVSRALNVKFAGVIRPGVYRGYELAPGGVMKVRVKNSGSYPRSVAIVERDGYSLTVLMDDANYVDIPAPGAWFVCIEAYYAPTQSGYQRIVAREAPESHHIVLGKVTVPADPAKNNQVSITQAMISDEGRQLGTITADPASLAGAGLNVQDNKLAVDFSLAPGSLLGRAVWNLASDVAANDVMALPSGLNYAIDRERLELHWLGLKLARGKDYQEIGAAGASGSSVRLLFPASAGDEFQAEIFK